jgi:gas vesicle protein
MAEDKNVGGMLVAFLAGSVVGAALALLFAPISGAETRKKIKSASIDTKERALERWKQLNQKLLVWQNAVKRR